MENEQLKELQRIRGEARRILQETAYKESKLKDKLNKLARYHTDPEYRTHVLAVVKRHRDKKRAERLLSMAAIKNVQTEESSPSAI